MSRTQPLSYDGAYQRPQISLFDFGLTKIKSQVRSEAAGVWWPVKADPEEEGEDDEEAGAEDGVHRLQVEEPGQS